ncbi:hypothetical protein [Chroococcidiopsis sp.]|uniref:hypothetical protein n=1 Tax=Chroococcidiopsis sp. TaxID=3088168 RepID=UPI003F31C28D
MTSKYNNTFVYFDPVTNRAYKDTLTGSLQFAPATQMSAAIKKRSLRFDSQHEYFVYRVVLLHLPANLQLLRQVNFLVIPKNNFGNNVFYRADLVIVESSITEKTFRIECAKPYFSTEKFLVIEPKGILTEVAKLKHAILCASNKIPIAQLLFVEMNHLLTVPSEARTTLKQLPDKLQAKINDLFTVGKQHGN